MATLGGPSTSPRRPLAVPMSSSPGSQRGRSIGPSDSRAESTARLASPVPTQPLGTSPVQQIPTLGHAANERSGSNSPLPGAGPNPTLAGPGVSALAAALSNSLGTSPPRFGTPPLRPLSPSWAAGTHSGAIGTPTNYGSFDTRARTMSGQAAQAGFEDPEIVKRHLVQPSDTLAEDSSRRRSSVGPRGKQPEPVHVAGAGLDDDEFSSLRLQGGDITRPIYRWTEEAEQRSRAPRSKSFSAPRHEPESEELDINSIKVPGGFRRNYLRRAARSPSAQRENGIAAGNANGGGGQPRLLTSNFIEFLSIYGHFAGEELEEDDEALLPGEYFSSGPEDDDFADGDEGSDDDREPPLEDSALLTPGRRKRKRKARGEVGNNSPMGAALLLLKSFVGTGVLFLPRAYLNGGMVFSNLVLLGVASLSYYCFVLLVTTRLKVPGSFGDIGGILYGGWMRAAILSSIVLSQIGFVAAYIVFTSENLQAFVLAVTDCKTYIEVRWFILMQMIVFLPFSLMRDISKLGATALVADAFIVIGLAYLFYYDILTLSEKGLADIALFNRQDWTLFIGTAIFTFEGIGLIIPIQESMRQPEKFPKVMGLVMIIITTLFTVMGAFSYAAYGSKTETVVLLNLPQDNKLVNGVQFLYSTAIMLSTPLQIFPAIKITENALFTRSGKYNPYIKWQKNTYRFFFTVMCAAIAWGGADDLDKFVALVGNFACIPLVYIYPPLVHFKAVARSSLWRTSDIMLCIFGFIAMAYTTSLTVMSWAAAPTGPELPSHCGDRKGV